VAQESVDSALRENAHAEQMASQFLLGTSLFHMGQLNASWEQIEQAVQAEGGPAHPALALLAGPDLGVFRCSYLSHLHCLFGNPSEAHAMSDESIVRAREVSHPFTLGIALNYAAMLNVYRGEGSLALTRADEASEICWKYGFAYYQAMADILAGWAIGIEGDTASGLARLRHGLEALKALRAELRLPFYHALLAEICGLAGRTGEALANIATGFAFLNKNDETWSVPELHRIHGDVLLQCGDATRARASFRRAVDLARRSGARLFEVRAEARLNELATHEIGEPNPTER